MVMKDLKRMVVLTTAFCGAIMPTIAQDKLDATVQADIVSQYIWRGQDLGDVSLQPTLGLSYKGLSLTAWGSVGLTDPDDTKEFDLTLSYKIGGLNIGITDYWFNTPSDRYFLYAAHETSHVFEGNIGYDFGPVALQWYTNFAGNDGVNKDGKRAYSSYFEVSAPFNLAGCLWQAAVGMVPYATSFYSEANGFAVTNVSVRATKDIHITKTFDLPLFAGISANPSTEKAYLVFGFTLRP